MLKGRLLHPEILEALAKAGHGSLVLIADGNYPLSTATSASASRVYLNLAPGLVSATDVLRPVLATVPVEGTYVMAPDGGVDPPIFAEFAALVDGPIERLDRAAFYDLARTRDLALAIATGEERLYANIILRIGVVPPAG